VLSGDRRARVERVARSLGIEHVRGDALPEDKLRYISALQQQGAIVAMVGDGVNDAPGLAQAQVSIATGGGTDLARASADIVLLGAGLQSLSIACALASLTMRVMRQNFAWAAAYNALALPMAAAGLLDPLAAAAGMSISSLAVIANALRLSRGPAERGEVQRESVAEHTFADAKT
jgi:Cu2+-exporting ATPase